MLRNPCILMGPQKRAQNQNWLPHPAFSGAHTWADMLRPPLACSEVPKGGDKIRIGCLIPAFSGARNWAEMLHDPYIHGGSQKRGQIHNWVPHACLLRGPKECANAT